MSTTTAKKKGRPRGLNKSRINVTITPAIHRLGQKAAFAEGLAFSQWLERLIREKMEVKP